MQKYFESSRYKVFFPLFSRETRVFTLLFFISSWSVYAYFIFFSFSHKVYIRIYSIRCALPLSSAVSCDGIGIIKKLVRVGEKKKKKETNSETKRRSPRPPGPAQLERKQNLFLILICIRNGGGLGKFNR